MVVYICSPYIVFKKGRFSFNELDPREFTRHGMLKCEVPDSSAVSTCDFVSK